jgi:predicted lipid-binding transport protein (Tim44 family)
MGYQPYAAPAAMEPPEAQSIKSMLHIARILAIIFGILLFIAGLGYAAFLIAVGLGFLIFFPVLLVIWGVVDFVIYLQLREIEALVNQRSYEQAKSKTLIWMILGFIIGGILVGILLLIAYLKFDPLITWQRGQGGPTPAYAAPPAAPAYAPPPATAPAPMAPPPPPAAPVAAPAVPNCANCGQPTTYIAQYGRYYCYSCARYV